MSFGSYDMVNKGKRNSMNHRSIPSIAVRKSNKDGGHLLILIYTGKEIHIYDCMESPIDDNIVKSVEDLAKIEKHPTFDQCTMFEWA